MDKKRKEAINVAIPPELHAQFKAKAALHGWSLREALRRILGEWVKDMPPARDDGGENDAQSQQ